MLNFLKTNDTGKKKQNFAETAAQFLFGNTLKAVNTVGATGHLAYDEARAKVADVTHNKKAFSNAANASASDAEKFNNVGGIANAGTFYKNQEEASKPISFGQAAKKSLGATVGIGTEILPFAKGAGVGIKGAEEAAKLSKGEKIVKELGTAVKGGAAYGAAGAAGTDLANGDNLSFKDIAKGTIQGGITGGLGYGVTKGGKGAVKAGKAAADLVTTADEKLMAKGNPHLTALNETYDQLNTRWNNASPTLRKQLDKAIKDNRSEFNKISQGGYVKVPGSKEPTPGEKPTLKTQAMDVIAPNPKVEAAKTAAATEAASVKPAAPVTITQALDAQLGKFDSKYKAPENIAAALDKSKTVGTPASKIPNLETFRDPTGVLASHFGETGSTAAYKLQQGAKTVSDIEEAIRPDIQKATKMLNKMAKSDVGRADIQSRIHNALEDRANADTILKTPQEKELYGQVQKVFDFFKSQRTAKGKNVLENYSPRTQVKDALDAPDRMLNNVKQAFSPNTQSQFSKTRINDIPDANINTRIIDLLPHYASSQAKEFGYTDAMNYIKHNLPNVNPAYISNDSSRRRGENYLQTMLTQILQPSIPTKLERMQNKLIGNTYKSALGFSPKFAAQNLTQRYATKTQVSKGAAKLVGRVDKADLEALRKEITTGFNPILSEMDQSATSTGKVRGVLGKVSNLDPGQKVEKGNVGGAFDRGVAQAVLESDIYKQAIKDGAKPKEAFKAAIADEATKDLAVRRGNMVVNTTQFGGNFAAKPEFLRDSGSFLGLSKKWYQQYQRFPAGMIQIMGNVVKPTEARALDILRRGDPRQTPIVDYWKAAKSLQGGVDDLIKGAKNGEIQGVTAKDAKAYKGLLDEAVGNLEKQIKQNSQIRAGKTLKNLGKMWAAASAIQFLFDGGDTSSTAQKNGTGAEVTKSIKYGAPLNIPTKSENPLSGARIPSSPINPTSGGVSGRKLLNFVPGVGLTVNRGRDIEKLITALTGTQ